MENEPTTLREALALRSKLEADGKVMRAREVTELIAEKWPGSAEGTAALAEVSDMQSRIAAMRSKREIAVAKPQTPSPAQWKAWVEPIRMEAAGVHDARTALDLSKIFGDDQQDVVAAVVFAERAVELQEDSTTVTRLAACYRAAHLDENALELYRDAWRKWPSDRHIVGTGAAAVFADRGEIGKAVETIEQVLDLAPTDSYALHAAGRIYRLDGQLVKAADCQERAAENPRTERQAILELRKIHAAASEAGNAGLVERLTALLSM